MRISKSGFYYWKEKPVSQRSKQNNAILYHVIQAHKASRKTYGSPRIHHDLNSKGIKVGLNKVAGLMQQHGIYASTSTKHRKAKIARNTRGFAKNILDRAFSADKPNKKWVSDTTFIYTQQGWLYLAIIIDLYSRKVTGWSMSSRNNSDLVRGALMMAIKNKPRKEKVLLHSDQGSTYRADNYLSLFKTNNIQQSMSAKGDCYDNAVAESFFGTLKTELVYEQTYLSREQARQSIFEYIEIFYNRVRRHSTLNYQSPENFEKTFYNAN